MVNGNLKCNKCKTTFSIRWHSRVGDKYYCDSCWKEVSEERQNIRRIKGCDNNPN